MAYLNSSGNNGLTVTRKEIDHWLDLLVGHTHDRWWKQTFVPSGTSRPARYFCHVCEQKTRDIGEHYRLHEHIARRMRDEDLYPLGAGGMRERVTFAQLAIFLDQIVTFPGAAARVSACVPRVYAIIAGDHLLTEEQRTRAYERAHDDLEFVDAIKAAAVVGGATDVIKQQIGIVYI